MFHFRRPPRPSDGTSSEKSAASESYRRTSIPNIITSSTPSVALSNSPGIPHRAPLAPLDPQSAYIAYPVLPDDQIVGRPIIARRTSSDDSGSSLHSARRRSIPNHSLIALSSSSSSHRLQLRRPSYSSTLSCDSSRRPSLSTIHAQSGASAQMSLPTSHPDSTPFTNPDFDSSGADDMYSDLASFTFGAARTVVPDNMENISPLTPISAPAFPDRTPRPSVSGTSVGGSYVDENGCPLDQSVDEEAVRQSRFKMRAMNDGSRRPSLPINSHKPGEPSSSARHSPSGGSGRQSSEEAPRTRRERKGSLDPDSRSFTAEDDGDNDGDFDTDVELDFAHDALAADTNSIHTFGSSSKHYGHSTEDLSDTMDVDRDHHHRVATRLDIAPWEDDNAYNAFSSGSTDASAGRRSSVPWVRSSGSGNATRDREDSAATAVDGRRMSRIAEDGIGIPVINADSVSNSSSVANGDAYDGLNLNYILGSLGPGGTRNSWDSGAPSYISPPGDGVNQRRRSAWALPIIGSRRPSAATTFSGEDTFTRHIRTNDPEFDKITRDWTFVRESADGDGRTMFRVARSGPESGHAEMPGTQQIWRQAYIGRYKVDRLVMHSNDPMRPPQHRMNIRPILDPYSRGNTRGGPTAVVHKHSRAPAFSIFRMYGLLGRNMRPSAHNTSFSILLATRTVQEHYTSTRTTSQLNSHGFLRDGQIWSGESRESDASQDQSHRSERAARSEISKKDKGKGRDGQLSNAGTSSGESSMGSVASHAVEDDKRRQIASQSTSSIAMSPTVVEPPHHSAAVSSPASETSESTLAQKSLTSISQPHTDRSSRGLTLSRVDLQLPTDDDDEMVPPRTSHAEAFATLDANGIEYLRGRPDQRSSDDSARSSRWRPFRFLGQNVRGPSRTSTGPPSASLHSDFNPPWLTMAPRSQQEERDRVMQNLNESFKDVGLLPTIKPRRGKNILTRKAEPSVDILEKVPPDSLHMLLPLWPGETDPASATAEGDTSTYQVPIENRQYLLVYYVPFNDDRDKKKNEAATKKRTWGETTSGGSTTEKSPKTVELMSFRVVARLISYRYLLGTGVRLPVNGLSITGPTSDALVLLPPPSYVLPQDQDDIVIGRCTNVNREVHFDPEGLVKLGLCMRVDPDGMDGAQEPLFGNDEEDRPPAWELTPIGRAAVEMAWLGSLAVTSFGENSIPGQSR